MDILEKKQNIADVIKEILLKFRIEKQPLGIKGSYSIQSQKYYGDIDLYQFVESHNKDFIYDKIVDIMTFTNKDKNIYFIELKFQNKDEKVKYIKGEFLKRSDFMKYFNDTTEFIKLDFILYFDFRFIELSINYYFNVKNIEMQIEAEEEDIEKPVNNKLITEFKKNIEELKKNDEYYKILKRIFSINKELNNKPELVNLSSFFNSNVGLVYQKYTNLEAIKKVEEYYKDSITKKRIETNLKALDIKKSDIDKEMTKMKDYINNLSKNYIKKNKIYI
jgi:hypothetical protein